MFQKKVVVENTHTLAHTHCIFKEIEEIYSQMQSVNLDWILDWEKGQLLRK